jgi:four helix bundle protein
MTKPIKSYRALTVWRSGIELTEEVYRLTTGFPESERYGLVAQLRRASVCVPSNIAEGDERGTREYAHFIGVARDSLAEIDTQFEIAVRLGYVNREALGTLQELLDHLSRALMNLRRKLAGNVSRGGG